VAKNPNAAKLGEVGEEFVANSLTTRGMRVLDRNWRIKEGEIDLVVEDREGTIIFIEVKTRSSISHGDPLESISNEKAFRIQRLALAWLATHQRLGSRYRIDVAGILVARSGEFLMDYREGVL
jgi:putative endonuclease